MDIMSKILLIWVIAANLVLLICMGLDKAFAKKHARRIPENVLFMLAGLGGGVGGVLGMLFFRHKTRHASFVIGFPLIALFQIALAVFFFLSR